MRTSVLALTILLCSFNLTAKNTNESNFAALQGLGQPDYHLISAEQSKQKYHLFVRTPAPSKQNVLYPTVFILDGGVGYPLLSGLYHYLRYTEEIPKLNLVGIAYGSDTYKGGNNRAHDYTAKSSERDYWGGADKFADLLANKIIPLVENHYPADPKKHIVFGQSLGGQFVINTAMKRPELFYGYIASNPALHRNLALFLQPVPMAAKSTPLAKLFVAIGNLDNPVYKKPADKWIKHWQQQAKLPWQLKIQTLPGQTHVSAAPDAFRYGIDWILSN